MSSAMRQMISSHCVPGVYHSTDRAKTLMFSRSEHEAAVNWGQDQAIIRHLLVCSGFDSLCRHRPYAMVQAMMLEIHSSS